jgi:DNA (cytosine-5)-methyltransferase 1
MTTSTLVRPPLRTIDPLLGWDAQPMPTTDRGTAFDFFCGFGGMSEAAHGAGVNTVLAANHSEVAVANHSANYTSADHVLGDLSVSNPRRWARNTATVMMASPACTHHSKARNHQDALRDLLAWDPKRAAERSRATMWCPQRWAAWHGQPAGGSVELIVLENVVEVCSTWEAFPSWCDEWDKLGWRVQAASLNSAFFGAAQSRDRIYFSITPKTAKRVDLDFRPSCWCWSCGRVVEGHQAWKKQAIKNAGPLGPVGKYGAHGQYVYRHSAADGGCGEVVSPFINPAACAIDWTLPATRIGDRPTPLKDTTMDRIRRGLAKLGYAESADGMLVPLGHTNSIKAGRPAWLPASTLTGRQDVALVQSAAHIPLRNNATPGLIGQDPITTVAAGGNHHGILQGPMGIVQQGGHTFERPGYARVWDARTQPIPVQTGSLDKAVFGAPQLAGHGFAVANYGNATRVGGHVRDTTEQPFGTLTTGGSFGAPQHAVLTHDPEALLSGYYGHGDNARDAQRDPAGVVTTRDRSALIQPPEGMLVRAGGTRQADLIDVNHEPQPTRMPRDSYGVMERGRGLRVEDCTFRMLTPRECFDVMDLSHTRDGRILHASGTNRDLVKLAGNAVTPGAPGAVLERGLQALGR